jgi:hypothetical protein
MTTDPQRFQRAVERLDAANAEDPNRELADGREQPKELLYAQRLSAMLESYAPDASEALRLAARCQHIRRWTIPRTDFPGTPAGYKQWRSKLQQFHAETAARILRDTDYGQDTVARVQTLLRKEQLKLDPEVQTLEDVVALVFLENYLEDFVARHAGYDEAKWIDILKKTWFKMSPRGRKAALSTIRLPASLVPLIRKAAELGEKMDRRSGQ